MRVHPTLIPKNVLLANISDVFNGVMVEGDMVGQTLFYGRGAGRNATASAVTADITDVAVNLAAGSVRRIPAFRPGEQFSEVLSMDEVSSRYYLRLQVKDCPGVIASITQILADKGISISSLIQHERREAAGDPDPRRDRAGHPFRAGRARRAGDQPGAGQTDAHRRHLSIGSVSKWESIP